MAGEKFARMEILPGLRGGREEAHGGQRSLQRTAGDRGAPAPIAAWRRTLGCTPWRAWESHTAERLCRAGGPVRDVFRLLGWASPSILAGDPWGQSHGSRLASPCAVVASVLCLHHLKDTGVLAKTHLYSEKNSSAPACEQTAPHWGEGHRIVPGATYVLRALGQSSPDYRQILQLPQQL